MVVAAVVAFFFFFFFEADLAPNDRSIWIGINDIAEPDNFIWQDGSEVTEILTSSKYLV